LILLIVSRLFLGELGHAMPVPGEQAGDHAIAAVHGGGSDRTDPHCGGHDTTKQTDAGEAASSGGERTTHAPDCCQTTLCDCACAQASPMASIALVVEEFVPESLTDSTLARAFETKRPSGVFRPPA
jgi:hypothetical protein